MKSAKFIIGIVMIFLLATMSSAYQYNYGGATHGLQKVYGVMPNTNQMYVRSNYGGAGYGFQLTRPIYHTTSLGLSSWQNRYPGYGFPSHNLRGFNGYGFDGLGLFNRGSYGLGAFTQPSYSNYGYGGYNSYASQRTYLGSPGYGPGGFYGHASGGVIVNHKSEPLLYPGNYRSFSVLS